MKAIGPGTGDSHFANRIRAFDVGAACQHRYFPAPRIRTRKSKSN